MRLHPGIAVLLLCAASGSPASDAADYTPDVIDFDGTNSLAFPSGTGLSLAGGGTIEFWVTPDWNQAPGYDPVIVANAGPGGASYVIALLRDRDGLAVASGGLEAVFPFDFTDGQLHHVALSRLDDGVVVMVDGQVAGTSTLPIVDLPSAGFWVGSIDGTNNAFRGAIAGLRIWRNVIAREELVRYAMTDVIAGDHPDLASLAALSHFTTGELRMTEAFQ